MKNFVNVRTCFLATLLVGAQCASASDVTSAEARGTCTMTNVRADKVIYDGRCIIDQAVEQNGRTTWFISLGDAEPMQFVGRGSDYSYGPENAQFKDYGDTGIFSWGDVDIIKIGDDLGTQESLMISPKMYREILKPVHADFIRFIKERTRAKVLFHSDGDVEPLIGDFIEIGVDILNPIQTSAGRMSDLHTVMNDVPPENVLAMVDAVEEFGQYPLT